MLGFPTVYREREFEFVIQTNDHPPPHVHVTRSQGHGKAIAKVWLDPVALCSAKNYKRHEVGRILHIVGAERNLLLREWEAIHAKRE